jgi:hypothetical protein
MMSLVMVNGQQIFDELELNRVEGMWWVTCESGDTLISSNREHCVVRADEPWFHLVRRLAFNK